MYDRFEIRVENDSFQLASCAARMFAKAALQAVGAHGRFSAALCGGETTRPFHRLLGHEPYFSEIDWWRTHLFWVDECWVPADHTASNFGTAQKDFIRRLVLNLDHLNFMVSGVSPQSDAETYAQLLQDQLPCNAAGIPILDLVVLGVGADGHIASLFCGQNAVNETRKWVAAVRGGQPDLWRLTLTLPVINAARKVMVLVSGQNKSSVVKEIFENRGADLPAQRIHPEADKGLWLMDRSAAACLRGLPPQF